jgi:hypothetical protein
MLKVEEHRPVHAILGLSCNSPAQAILKIEEPMLKVEEQRHPARSQFLMQFARSSNAESRRAQDSSIVPVPPAVSRSTGGVAAVLLAIRLESPSRLSLRPRYSICGLIVQLPIL